MSKARRSCCSRTVVKLEEALFLYVLVSKVRGELTVIAPIYTYVPNRLFQAYKHWEYHGFENLQVVPETQAVRPVHPIPPHCPQRGEVPPLVGGLEVVAGGVDVDVDVGVMLVIVVLVLVVLVPVPEVGK